jgi:hypothetical protein
MLRIQEDEVVESLLAKGTIEPFDVRRGIGCPVGDGDALDAHHVCQPQVEAATVAAAFLATSLAVTKLTEDPVVVVEQETRARIPHRCLTELLLHPGQPRAGGGVDEHDAPGSDLNHDEDVDNREEDRELGQEVDGEHLARVAVGVALLRLLALAFGH